MKCRRINARKEDLAAISDELGLRSKMELGPIIDTVSGILADIKENRDTAVLEIGRASCRERVLTDV